MLAGETFDVVIADYLVGSIDGFAPYYQDQIYARLRPHVTKHLYVAVSNDGTQPAAFVFAYVDCGLPNNATTELAPRRPPPYRRPL
jgi:hypothetical protein